MKILPQPFMSHRDTQEHKNGARHFEGEPPARPYGQRNKTLF